ncbi:inverse autotransporter beta-barrel domain-containing protein [Acaryochloris marina]|uniref:Right handed beta helix domain-containing protein n=1 Tax=Acaryochloris marina (strain MBIC 11017) TaxID=329726 RepID=B0C6A0_ACAM1|nr:inverse autotransporter beta-barrel domain-containing protein [Acaryochloris marina]ABW25194.1 hypothetical protein AM1_0106 [Acaryochloris marina MBIC11017]BDM80161.1 hypothetical protein AM10699_30290 [Acaryochloris marina MBIC10699]
MARRRILDPRLFPNWGQALTLSVLMAGLSPLSTIAKPTTLISPLGQPTPSKTERIEPEPISVQITPIGDLDLALKLPPIPTTTRSSLQNDPAHPPLTPQEKPSESHSIPEPSITDLPNPPLTLAEAGWVPNSQTVPVSSIPVTPPTAQASPIAPPQASSDAPSQTPEDPEPSASLDIPYFVDAEFRGSTRRQFGVLNLRLPVFQDEKSFAFADVHFEAGSNETFLGNLGLAYRRVLNTAEENPWVLGTYAFYDTTRSENGFQYHQGSLGAELISKKFEFRVNGYLPGSNSKVVGQRTVNGVLSLQPRANGLGADVVQQTLTLETRERALAGFDFEVGHRHHFNDKVSLGLFGGYFFFDSSATNSIDGPMARAQLEVQDPLGMNGGLLQVGSRFRFDETRGSELEGFVRLGIPFGGPQRSEPLSLTQRLARRPIERHYEITTFAQDINLPITLTELQAALTGQGTLSPMGPQITAVTPPQVALNPATGQPINIFFVDGDGTAGDGTQDNPLTVAQATSAITQANDILFFLDDAGTINTQTGLGNSLTLKPGQQALGVGTTPNFVLTVPNLGSVTIFDAGQPQLVNGANNNVLTLANNNTIDGLAFNGQNTAPRGIAAVTGATNTTIRNSSLSNFTVAGIQITPSTNTTIDNVVFNNNATDVIVNAANTTLTNVVSTNATGPAIQILNATGTTTLTNVDISNAGGDGLQFANPSGTITATNVDITNAGDNGLEITDGDGTFTFDVASSITNATNAAVNVVGGTTTITYNGTITQNNPASAVNITDKTGGTTTFNGLVTANTSTAPGVNLTNNTGSTIAFNGGLDIDTTTGTGFSATNGGTVNVTATSGDESVTTTSGAALNLSNIVANITFDSVSSTGGTNGINLDTVTGSVGVSGTTTIANTTGDGFLATNSTGTYTFGPVTITNAGLDGVDLSGINDATTVFNLGALTINGFTGTGINLAGANVGVTAPTVAITNTGNVGTGIDLTNTTGNRMITLGDPTNTAGDTPSSIAGVNVGVQLNNANANFIFGDGELTVDAPSTIAATTPIDASAVGANGTYNFLDVLFLNQTPGTGLGDLFYVDNIPGGAGTRTDPADIPLGETITNPNDIIILVDNTGMDLLDAIGTNGNDTFQLQDGQSVGSFLNGTVNLRTRGPSNVLANVTVTDPTGNGAPTSTTTGMSSATLTLANNNQIIGVDISAMGTNGIEALGVNNATINRNRITNADNGIRLQNLTGAVEIMDNTISQTTDDGIDLGQNNTNLDSVLISGNTVSNVGEDGIDVDVYNNGLINSVTISNNTVSEVNTSESSGIALNVYTNGQVDTVTISGNTVSTDSLSTPGIFILSADNSTLNTANITGNTVMMSREDTYGIYVLSTDNSAINTANITSNRVSLLDEDLVGILALVNNNSTITTATISDNTLSKTGDGNTGIDVGLINSTLTTANISGNTFITTDSDNTGIEVDLINSTLSTANISGNTFNTTVNDVRGIDIDIYNSTLTTANISANTLSLTGGDSSGVNLQLFNGSVINTATISDNSITTTDESISIELDNSTVTTANITGNNVTTSANNADGIFVSSFYYSTINTANITGNNVTTSGTNADGIFVESYYYSTINTANITGNNVTTSGTNADGIVVIAEDDYDSRINTANISNNVILQAGRDSVRISNSDINPICTSISGNRSDSPGFAMAGGTDFNLISEGNTFQVVNLATVSADNNNAVFSFDGTLVPPGTPPAPFTNVASCP